MVRRLGVFALLLSVAGLMAVGSMADEKKPTEKSISAQEKTDKPQKEEAKFTAKCPISGADAKKEQAAKYKEKEVYFCCGDCKAAFEKDNTKHVVKANHQLVQTKQYRQAKCPLSGGDLNKEQVAKINGVNVQFCCEKCQGKVAAASAEEQLTMAFSEEAFKKAFVARKAGAGKKKDAEKGAGT